MDTAAVTQCKWYTHDWAQAGQKDTSKFYEEDDQVPMVPTCVTMTYASKYASMTSWNVPNDQLAEV